jgi:hypothetical protein
MDMKNAGSVDNGGTVLQAGRSLVRVPMGSLHFSNLPNPVNLTMALGFTQPVT